MPRPKLPELERLARKRMRRVSPENASKVLSRDIYWTVPFLALFLERCDDLAFDDPQTAHQLAFYAPPLADRIGVGSREGEYTSVKVKRSFRVQALAVYASTCRRVGRLTEATTQYRLAFELATGGILAQAEAELFCRYGNLKAKNAQAEALDHFDRALQLYTAVEDAAGTAQTLVLRAGWSWSTGDRPGAAEDLAHALAVAAGLRGDPRARRATTAALVNLARLNAEGLSFQGSSTALELIGLARKRLANQSLSVTKMKLIWIEGSLNRNICFFRPAIRLLAKAREGFRQLRLAPEFGMTSLEMAVAMLDEECCEELPELREDTLETLHALADDPLLISWFDLWRIETRRDGLLRLKQTVSEQLS